MPDANAPAGKYAAIAKLVEPKSIAVIGASDQPGNLGGRAVAMLRKFNFPGEIWPVNPGRETVCDLRCYRSLKDLPHPADLAILAVSAKATVDTVRDCVAAGIHHGIVWAGGFAEGGPEGVARQQQLTALCRETGFYLCGPNSLGIINSWLPMTGTFASSLVTTDRLLPGNISMVSQSGGQSIATQALCQQAGFGFRYLISSGNEAVLNLADYLEALVDDPHTSIIAVYLEGLKEGSAFTASLARARSAGKPVVLVKTGLVAATGRAAAAHTGALVGDDRVWQAILREHGVITVTSIRELVDVSVFLSSIDRATLPRGRRVAIITFGGGGGVLSTDLCARNGLETPVLTQATREKLAPLVPPIASIINPIDMTPASMQSQWLERFPEALDTIAADPNIDAVFFPLGAMARGGAEVARAIAQFRRRTPKTVCLSWTLAPKDGLELLAADGLYVFPEPSRAIEVLAKAARYATAPVRQPDTGAGAREPFDWGAFVPDPRTGLVIPEHTCHRILAAAGLPVAAGRLARGEADAIAAAHAVGFPLALKGISPAVTQRAAAGLLALDLRNENELQTAHRRLTARAAALGIALDGLYVQHMSGGGTELLVSAFRDPVFGVMVTCGAGGALTELIDDVTLERAPFDTAQAEQVLRRLRIFQRAARRDPTVDLQAPAEFVARFSRLVASAPWRRFVLEVNPIQWQADTVTAVDGLLIIEEP